jgi:hypothetical protein
LLAIHPPPKSPTRFREDSQKKATQTIPLVFISSAEPEQLGIEIFGPNAENDPDRIQSAL